MKRESRRTAEKSQLFKKRPNNQCERVTSDNKRECSFTVSEREKEKMSIIVIIIVIIM
jgi:hypothetical protein